MSYFKGIFALLWAAAFSLLAYAQTGVPTFEVGDRWVYNRTYLETGKEIGVYKQQVSAVSPKSVEIFVEATTGFPRSFRFQVSPEGNTLSFHGRSFDPPYPLLKFPMKVGEEWNLDVTMSESGKYWTENVAGKVVRQEEVKVAAGTFMTYRIEIVAQGSRGGLFKEVNWYAPEVKRMVRRHVEERSFSKSVWQDELVEYQVKGATVSAKN